MPKKKQELWDRRKVWPDSITIHVGRKDDLVTTDLTAVGDYTDRGVLDVFLIALAHWAIEKNLPLTWVQRRLTYVLENIMKREM